MIRRLGAALAALLLLGALAGCDSSGGSGGSGGPAAAKDQFPAVSLPGLGGSSSVDLGSLHGPLVVNLWASWCGPCKRELPLYAAFAKKFAGKVDVLGIDFQETSDSRALAMMHTAGVDYPVVSDRDGRLRAIGLPKLVLVDSSGKVAFSKYVEIKSADQLEQLVRDHLKVAG